MNEDVQKSWTERWDEGRIGFHEDEVNPVLQRHFADTVGLGRVLVPLSGKSVDVLWLGSQPGVDEVVAVELSERAVEAFHEENGLTPERDTFGVFKRYRSGRVTTLCGDFFQLGVGEGGLLTTFDGIYDRAALIALDSELRKRYVAHLAKLMGKGATGLLVTLDYDQAEMSGPPFSVDPQEALGYAPRVESVAKDDLTATSRLTSRGLSRIGRSVWAVGW